MANDIENGRNLLDVVDLLFSQYAVLTQIVLQLVIAYTVAFNLPDSLVESLVRLLELKDAVGMLCQLNLILRRHETCQYIRSSRNVYDVSRALPFHGSLHHKIYPVFGISWVDVDHAGFKGVGIDSIDNGVDLLSSQTS